jgi:dethiobiotin synthetase
VRFGPPWPTKAFNVCPVRGIFVTGTDTGVGKTVLAAAICAALVERGERVAAFKPVVTGLDEPAGEWPPDHELLASVANAGQSPADVAPARFGPPASPHLAAELAGTRLEPLALARAGRAAAERADLLVCEGVGGLMVPLTSGYLVRDLALDLDLPLVVAARPGLGTVSHSLLTVEAARTAGLEVRAVVLTPWPEEPNAVERSNRETIAALGDVRVATLPRTAPGALAEAGRALPLRDWL